MKPRQVPDRDSYYMGRAWWASRKSKDPRTQVGAYIVSVNHEPISSGYNGPPAVIPDNSVNWERPFKYSFVHHAEDNAIWFGRHKCMKDGTIYVTAPPCKACMLDIARTGIKRVVYFRPKTDSGSLIANAEEWQITQQIAYLSLIALEEFQGNLNWMRDDIGVMQSLGVFGCT